MLKRKSIDCHIRLLYEYAGILDFIQQEKDANQIPPFAVIVEKSNLFVWYFLILGPESTAYEGGHYIGRITFSDEYPKREPIFIEMLTPTGCFKLQEPISIKQLGYKEWKPPKT
uniref:UBC core domain-containing protein n=1 Tax=Acrobeloides nanus TaxID=290746 RepID=A0A914CBF1_9BILA